MNREQFIEEIEQVFSMLQMDAATLRTAISNVNILQANASLRRIEMNIVAYKEHLKRMMPFGPSVAAAAAAAPAAASTLSTIYFDGSADPNPGPGGYGGIFIDSNGIEHEYSHKLAHTTNNEAEYRAMIAGIELAIQNGQIGSKLIIRGDSQLVIRQMNGQYKVSSATLRPLYQRAKELASQIGDINIEYEWIPREQNARADQLSKA